MIKSYGKWFLYVWFPVFGAEITSRELSDFRSLQGKIGNSLTFLVGARSRFASAICFNKGNPVSVKYLTVFERGISVFANFWRGNAVFGNPNVPPF